MASQVPPSGAGSVNGASGISNKNEGKPSDPTTDLAARTLVAGRRSPGASYKRPQCFKKECNRRLNLVEETMKCLCGKMFCNSHRFPEYHDCEGLEAHSRNKLAELSDQLRGRNKGGSCHHHFDYTGQGSNSVF